MPAAMTHFLQAERVMEELKKQDDQILIHRDAFLWGAQGPDFLYCHRYLPWQHGKSFAEYAEKLHVEQPEGLFQAMREYCAMKNQDGTALSYLYGFLCHYSLDRIAHPFIQYGSKVLLEQNPEQDEGIFHNEIESALDVIMLRYERSDLPVDFNLKWTVPRNQRVQMQIADLYAFVFNRIYGLEDSGAGVFQATKDCRRLFGLLNDRTTMKKYLVERFEKPRGRHSVSCHIRPVSEGDAYDYANILLADWCWPMDHGKQRNESFFELYESSVAESLELIQHFFNQDKLNQITNKTAFA